MLLPEHEWTYAPYLVFDARRVLARVLTISQQIHGNAYSIPSVALELGVPVKYIRDDSFSMIGMCARDNRSVVITLNDAVEDTLYDMAGLVHELGHAVVDEVSLACKGSLRKSKERDAWLRGIYVAISRPLAESIHTGRANVREVAGRCCVPTPIVEIRAGLAVALGEVDGDRDWAYELIADQLLALEQWFNNGRRDGFQGAGRSVTLGGRRYLTGAGGDDDTDDTAHRR